MPVLVAAAAQEVAESLQPGDVCGAFGVCPGGGGGALQGPLDCPMCKLVVVAFVTRLQVGNLIMSVVEVAPPLGW